MSDSLLDENEVEIPAASGEPKKRRGRPPGSKNKPRGTSESLPVNLENAIRGIFAICGMLAKWFGYEQVEELTDEEAKEGSRALVPIANKIPWLANVAVWIGAPVWFIVTLNKKFRKAPDAKNDSGNLRGNDGNRGIDSSLAREGDGIEIQAAS